MKRPLGVALAFAALVLVAVVSLVLTGVWSPPWAAQAQSDSSGGISVAQGSDVTLPSRDGSPEVRIPAASFSGDGRLQVNPVDLPEGRHGWSIELSGAQLTGEATVIFKNAVADGAPAPLVGFTENPGDEPQYVLDTEVSGKDLIVRTTHFSNWFTESWDWVTNWARGQLDRIYKDSGTGEQPKCEREAEARSGNVSVTSDSGGRVRWCLGKGSDGSTVLKVNNSRGYAVSAERTPGLTMATRSLDFSQMVPRLAKYITAPSKRGNSIDIIGPGETVEYKVAAGVTAVGVRLQPSPPAYLATALWFGIETTGMVYTKVLGKVGNETIGTALDAANCVAGFQGLATADVTDVKAAARYMNDATATVMSCMGKVFMNLAKGRLFDVVAVTIAQVFSWVWSGIQTAANGFAAAADTALNFNGYTITVTYPVSAPATPSAAEIPGLPPALGGNWCSRSTPKTCFSDAETKKKYPAVRAMGSSPATDAPGATDYHLCIKLDLGDDCTTASTIYLRYFPSGTAWDCVQREVVMNRWPACDPDYTSFHDSSEPRLIVRPNHQQATNYIDAPPLYRTQ